MNSGGEGDSEGEEGPPGLGGEQVGLRLADAIVTDRPELNPDSIEAHTLTITNFLSTNVVTDDAGGTYVMPHMQRPYEWTAQMAGGLCKDLLKNMKAKLQSTYCRPCLFGKIT